MDLARFEKITGHYPSLRVAIIGDFCLDRYLEVDPAKQEISIETGLPVHNVVNVRSQPGGAGTILNNLAALGVGEIHPVGFCGEDGEGFELRLALQSRPGVRLQHFLATHLRRTFTYCKPLLMNPNRPPEELNRLDSKNWTPTPALVQGRVLDATLQLAEEMDAFILLDQVALPETGVVTRKVLEGVDALGQKRPDLPILADSRRGLRDFPPVIFKMNAAELSTLSGTEHSLEVGQVRTIAAALARKHGRPVFVTLSDRGILGADPAGEVEHVPALPVRGPIDIVGAGDAVTANLTAALAAGASAREAMEIAMAAASIVIHQLGTTGTASVNEIRSLLEGARPC
jgi:rfaE bifunctional protein kinase chain/domain